MSKPYSSLDRRIIDAYQKLTSTVSHINDMYHNRIAECIDKDSNTGKIKSLGIYDTVTKKYAIIELNNYRTKKIEDVVELKHIKNILSEVGNG